MKRLKPTLVAALSAMLFGASAAAVGGTTIVASGGWVRWLPGDLPAGGYLTLTNRGDRSVDLVEVESPDYGSAMLHQSLPDGSMRMAGKLPIPPHGTAVIAPRGYHLMLERPKRSIAPGDTVHVELKFSDGTALDVPLQVKPPAQP